MRGQVLGLGLGGQVLGLGLGGQVLGLGLDPSGLGLGLCGLDSKSATNNQFLLQARCPSCRPTNSVRALTVKYKVKTIYSIYNIPIAH